MFFRGLVPPRVVIRMGVMVCPTLFRLPLRFRSLLWGGFLFSFTTLLGEGLSFRRVRDVLFLRLFRWGRPFRMRRGVFRPLGRWCMVVLPVLL